MEFFLFIVLLGSWAVTWILIKERLKARHFVVRHAAGAAAGFVAMMILGVTFVAVGLIESKKKEPVAEPSTREETPRPTAAPATPSKATVAQPKPAPLPKKEPINVEYKVTRDDLMAPWKRSVEIQLDERISEEELRWIAARIMAAGTTKTERTFIGYRLKGQPKESAYWATTHHNPNLDVRIQGMTKEEFANLSSMKVPDAMSKDVVGTWIYEVTGLSTLNVVYRKQGKLFLARVFVDGRELSNEELEVKKLGGQVRFAEKGNEHDEYFTFDDKGEMVFWGIGPEPFDRALPRDKPSAAELANLVK